MVLCNEKDVSVQSLGHVRLCDLMDCSTPGSLPITSSQSLLKLMSIRLVVPSNHLILCCQLLLPPSIFPSIRVFSKESVLCIRCPKYWSFSLNISHSNEHSGLISFRMGWLDLFTVQGTLKSLLQHHSSKDVHHTFFHSGESHEKVKSDIYRLVVRLLTDPATS